MVTADCAYGAGNSHRFRLCGRSKHETSPRETHRETYQPTERMAPHRKFHASSRHNRILYQIVARYQLAHAIAAPMASSNRFGRSIQPATIQVCCMFTVRWARRISDAWSREQSTAPAPYAPRTFLDCSVASHSAHEPSGLHQVLVWTTVANERCTVQQVQRCWLDSQADVGARCLTCWKQDALLCLVVRAPSATAEVRRPRVELHFLHSGLSL